MKNAFTLIELLVVIAIISIISSILFVAIDPKGQVDKAKITIVQKELGDLAKAMYLAKTTNGTNLIAVTGSVWSMGPCLSGNEQSQACINNWTNVRDTVSAIDDYPGTNILNYVTDPWGVSYMLDENEGEGGGCRRDEIFSAGPNMILERGADDIKINIPNSTPACI